MIGRFFRAAGKKAPMGATLTEGTHGTGFAIFSLELFSFMIILVGKASRTDADIGVSGFGRSKEEALAQAALALTGVITEPESVSADESVQNRAPRSR
jgi:hypothetical protein